MSRISQSLPVNSENLKSFEDNTIIPELSTLPHIPLTRTGRSESNNLSYPANFRDPSNLDVTTNLDQLAFEERRKGARIVLSKSQDLRWFEKYEELKKYKEKFGDTAVRVGHKTLGRWTATQREHYKLYLKGERSAKITQQRVDLLNKLEFCWEIHDHRWDEQFKALITFRSLHGHCNVPRKYLARNDKGKDLSLGLWVRRQRDNYKQKSNALSKEKIAKLDFLNFQW